MSGTGVYKYPDGTSLSATWENNEPTANCIYKDPLGHVWLQSSSNNQVRNIIIVCFKLLLPNENVSFIIIIISKNITIIEL